jgi:hypothetical protein
MLVVVDTLECSDPSFNVSRLPRRWGISDLMCPLLKTGMYEQTVEKAPLSNFIKICSAVLRLFHAY